VPQRVDFSDNSLIYDRRHGALISDQLSEALGNRLAPGSRIVDIGAGTGRVSVALAAKGFRMVALDPAIPMLQKIRQKSVAGSVHVAAEGTRLPLGGNSADAVALARLLYLVPDWRALLRESMRILRRGGILLHEWVMAGPMKRGFRFGNELGPYSRWQASRPLFIPALDPRWRLITTCMTSGFNEGNKLTEALAHPLRLRTF
jgi:SAM-dependent methyltransferase